MIDWHCFPAVLSYIVWGSTSKKRSKVGFEKGDVAV